MINISVSKLKENAPIVAFSSPVGDFDANGQRVMPADRFNVIEGADATDQDFKDATAVQLRYDDADRERMLKAVDALRAKYPHLKKVRDGEKDPRFTQRLYTISTGGTREDNVSTVLSNLGIELE